MWPEKEIQFFWFHESGEFSHEFSTQIIDNLLVDFWFFENW